MVAKRKYQRVKTLPPSFWHPELRQYFVLWLRDMACGMQPYTPRTVQTFERRFILYTRMGWEGKEQTLTLEDVFRLANIY
jgi:hypothetical protein